MRTVTCLLVIACMFLAATSAEAGGLFRRVPEVGEWAAFDWSLRGEDVNSRGQKATHEFDATLTVKCVGEETVDGRRYLWIECLFEAPEYEGVRDRKIFKTLVPESVLADRESTLDDVRGWAPNFVSGREPLEFSAADGEVGALRTMTEILLGDGEQGDAEQVERTIEVDGQEHVLTRFESGPVPLPHEPENENITKTVEGTWWLSEDLAFGVAALEITVLQVNRERESEEHGEIRFELIATGTGAVSDLPDHN